MGSEKMLSYNEEIITKLEEYFDPIEAFEAYKYYSINGITKDVYDKLLNIEILPYQRLED